MKSLWPLVLALFLHPLAYGNEKTFEHNESTLSFCKERVEIAATGQKIRPALDLAQNTIQALGVTGALKGLILSKLLPAEGRRYYQISPNSLTPELQTKLQLCYEQETHRSQSARASWQAVTLGQDTFLLPSFVSLSNFAQAAVLFGEGLLVLNPQTEYSKILSARSAIEEHMRSKKTFYGRMLFDELRTLFVNRDFDWIVAAAHEDRANGHTNLSLADIFGSETLNLLHQRMQTINWADRDEEWAFPQALDRYTLGAHLLSRISQFPTQHLYYELYQARNHLNIMQPKVRISYFREDVSTGAYLQILTPNGGQVSTILHADFTKFVRLTYLHPKKNSLANFTGFQTTEIKESDLGLLVDFYKSHHMFSLFLTNVVDE